MKNGPVGFKGPLRFILETQIHFFWQHKLDRDPKVLILIAFYNPVTQLNKGKSTRSQFGSEKYRTL